MLSYRVHVSAGKCMKSYFVVRRNTALFDDKAVMKESFYTEDVTCERNIKTAYSLVSRSQWPRGLRRRSTAARLLRLWIRIPLEAWKFVCCGCCVLSGRGLCDELITRPEESYRLWCVVGCDLETSRMRRPWPTGGGGGVAEKKKKKKVLVF